VTIAAIIQARTGSTRLPGKVLLPCAGATVLERMLDRVRAARTPSHVIVATTRATEDDRIAELAARAGVRCVRGHTTDLLDRHREAAISVDADIVVKIPSDCPLIDPETIDRVIRDFLAQPVDYASNLHPPTWPDGFDVEVMTRDALETAWCEATRSIDREHTTPYLWDNPEHFRTRNVRLVEDYSRRYRLTLDYREDYDVIRAVFEALWSASRVFSFGDILDVITARPWWTAANAMYLGTSWMSRHLGELRTTGGAQ
jgi:spore coat polysaccharide biosynthesis protein SpsF